MANALDLITGGNEPKVQIDVNISNDNIIKLGVLGLGLIILGFTIGLIFRKIK
jgi:hypothetical protein